jgi:hypothetical protein
MKEKLTVTMLLITTIVWGYGLYYSYQQYVRWYSEGQSYWEWSSPLSIGVGARASVFFGKLLRRGNKGSET